MAGFDCLPVLVERACGCVRRGVFRLLAENQGAGSAAYLFGLIVAVWQSSSRAILIWRLMGQNVLRYVCLLLAQGAHQT
jgi:hypothetical protein